MNARNMNELQQMLTNHLRKAMEVTSKKVLADMYDETGGFYTQGNPKKYKRTGALGDTPKTTPITSGKGVVTFRAYLDDSTNYTTGDKPSMTQVLNLANYGKSWRTKNGALAKATLGKKGFWERAENKMQDTFDKTMKQFFK